MKISTLMVRAISSLVFIFPFVGLAPVARAQSEPSASKKIWNDYLQVMPELQLAYAKKNKTPLSRTSLDMAAANKALVLASTNKVTSLGSLSKYDPPPGPIGFCFGRAFATQTFASMQGLKDSSIRKLFIIGDLRSSPAQPEWGFHVTTLVLGTDQHWYAIDPIYGNTKGQNLPIPAAVWIKWVRQNWDTWHGEKGGRAFLYLAEASAMMPDVRKYPEGIIDSTKFKPNEHGITQDADITKEFQDAKVFVLTPEQTTNYFLNFSGRREDKNFDFVKLQIQTETFDFRNYFADFNQTLINPSANAPLSFTESRRTGRPPLGLDLSSYGRRR